MTESQDQQSLEGYDILCRGQVVRLGLLHPEMVDVAYVVPLNYGYDADDRCLYMHTHDTDKDPPGELPQKGSLKLKAFHQAIEHERKICFEVETDVHILPLAGGTSCMSTTRFCSVIGYGTLELITDDKERKKHGLSVILRQNTGLPTQYWKDFDEDSLAKLVIVKLSIAETSAIRHGYDFSSTPA
jgi:nitroimidazol reductase NimA-like FMN-containing flavoprotein (pyridoxamine 5'-phosphate oxidase superfamily)